MIPLNFYGRYFPVVQLSNDVSTVSTVNGAMRWALKEMLFYGPKHRVTLCSYFPGQEGLKIRDAIQKSLIRRRDGQRLHYLDAWLEDVPQVPPSMLRVIWLLDWLHGMDVSESSSSVYQKAACGELARLAIEVLADSAKWAKTPIIPWLERYIMDFEAGRYD